ncbi:hypothetical protein T4E_8200 [Trichinella pseudospiralis]|uniref:Uncharacterized protein n=1 Tax=Trichinella pseudospiralis TaxID=6337 RepID=A0A0V0XY18_TRIPS|nr:hypothetical protein T4E_8200 [Trichinella pseudospiralis]
MHGDGTPQSIQTLVDELTKNSRCLTRQSVEKKASSAATPIVASPLARQIPGRRVDLKGNKCWR